MSRANHTDTEPLSLASTPAYGDDDTASDASSWRDRVEFLRGFLREPARVGSVIPSSHRLEQRLVRNARLHDARTLVELGPGTGGTTRAFLRALAPNARLLAIELDPGFHARLAGTVHDARFSLQLGSAEQIEAFLQARRLPRPDAVISGIPFSTMPTEVSERIAQAIGRVLVPGGRFVAYQVRAHVAGFLTPHLGAPDKQWELINIPPVRVFTWVKR
jgi:phospholipid N-methyltransferase